jgi:hypothetical protein
VGEEKKTSQSIPWRKCAPLLLVLPLLMLAGLTVAALHYSRDLPTHAVAGEHRWVPGFVKRWEEKRVRAREAEIYPLEEAADSQAVERLRARCSPGLCRTSR